jgi:hypothetical protein
LEAELKAAFFEEITRLPLTARRIVSAIPFDRLGKVHQAIEG